MADTLLIYAGEKATMPSLLYRQLGYCYDTQEIYIGGRGDEGNLLIGAVTWGRGIEALKTGIEISTVPADANLATVVTALNTIIGSLQAAGIMDVAESVTT